MAIILFQVVIIAGVVSLLAFIARDDAATRRLRAIEVRDEARRRR